MRHKKLLTPQTFFLNELMYDFDKKSKQNIRAIYYIAAQKKGDDRERLLGGFKFRD